MSVSPLRPRFRLSLCCAMTICQFAFVGTRPALAQFVSNSQTTPPATAPKPSERSDKKLTTEVSLSLFGQFTPTRNETTVDNYSGPSGSSTYSYIKSQGTSSSAGIEATFHQQFRRFRGYNINLGYSRFTEKFMAPESKFVGTNMYEVGATAVFEGPRTRRFSSSAETGISVLTFLPTLRPSEPHLQFRAALAFGIGVNYKLNSYLNARIGYKGLFYQNPDFRSAGYSVGDPQLLTVTSEPTVSLVYTFGRPHPKASHLFH